MATYVILNIVFMAVVLLALKIRPHRPSKVLLLTALLLVLLTAVFDNVIILLDIVNYEPSKILGIRIGSAPIEDFMYALLALVIVPVVWRKLGRSNAQS